MHPLVSASDLARLVASSTPPVVLDVRWRLQGPPGRSSYDEGHVPGAVFVDLDHDLAGPAGSGGRHPLPEAAALQASLRRAGVGERSHVVAYDDGDGAAAARAWWLHRWAGHDDVQVLDGGWRAWVAASLPVSTDEPTVEPGDVVVAPGSMPVVDADGAASVAESGVLLDARASQRFRGETEPVDPVAGHVPDAVNLPATTLVGDDGRVLPGDQIRARLAEAGADGRTPVAAMCGSGVTAALTVLALDTIGVRASLYAGSWSEWVTDPSRPVATGE